MSNKKNDDFDLMDRQKAAADDEEETDNQYDSQMSMNRSLEKQDRQDKKGSKWRGKALPVLKNERDIKDDKEPITPEDLGLQPEDEFLIERKLTATDMRKHQDTHEKDFLGTNMRRSRDFLQMFDKGSSSEEKPKMDLAYNVEFSPNTKKQLIAEQMLRNLESSKKRESDLADKILKEMIAGKASEEEMEEIEEVEDFRDPEITENIANFIPNNAI